MNITNMEKVTDQEADAIAMLSQKLHDEIIKSGLSVQMSLVALGVEVNMLFKQLLSQYDIKLVNKSYVSFVKSMTACYDAEKHEVNVKPARS